MTDPRVSQKDLDAMLSRGVLFSFLWLAGFGSLYALRCGFRARRMILSSDGALIGWGRTWWCLVVGALGVLFWFPIFIVGIINNLRKIQNGSLRTNGPLSNTHMKLMSRSAAVRAGAVPSYGAPQPTSVSTMSRTSCVSCPEPQEE